MNLALTAIVLGLAVVAAATDDRNATLSRAAKMAAATGVIVVLAIGADWSAYAVLVLVALLLSWVGDLALSYSGRRPFVVGLVSFALAHVMYTAAFIARGGLSWTLLIGTAIVMVVFSAVVLRWLAPHRPGELAAPLAAYVAIIGVMVAFAFATLGSDPLVLIPVAALAFTASDLFVARQRFVTPSPTNRLIGLPLYFAAQLMFALSTW
ncbi:MAG: lysoplasmalogenase family protein [Acidimicrobiia bacterium]